MEKLIVTLKQHTPLVHFQHEEQGATLRASEVKPLLDRFIITKLFDDSFERCKTYLQGYSIEKEVKIQERFNNGFRALNYSIKVIPQKRDESVQLQTVLRDGKYYTQVDTRNEDFPFLMSNMGGKSKEEELINFVLHDTVTLLFCTHHFRLHEVIKQIVPIFFARTNFGQRKTKGFGSFSVSKINGIEQEWDEESLLPSDQPMMQFSLVKKNTALDKQYALFKTLDFYWRCLKSGINFTRKNDPSVANNAKYIKSYLWTYLNKNNLTWEKRKIKEHFSLLTGDEKPKNQNPPFFARALLGCPDKFEYKNLRRTVSIAHDERDKDLLISRIPTPIIFKPVVFGDDVSVYILFDPKIRRELRELPNHSYKFSCPNWEDLHIDINVECINYKELIFGFHRHITSDKNTRASIFYQIAENRIEDETMIPRDFRWNNILGGNEVVRFFTTD